MDELAGKTAVLAGASTGIGRALAIALGREGMNVVLASTNTERLEAAAAAVRETGARAVAVTCDVADARAVEGLADQAFAAFGEVHLLCNNAGVTTFGPLADHTLEDWAWVFGVCLMGAVHGVQAFLPHMLERGSGHILTTGSPTGIMPDTFLQHGPYSSAKAAVGTYTITLRQELAPRGIGVSLLLPGWVPSSIAEKANLHGPVKPGERGAVAYNPEVPPPTEGARVRVTAETMAEFAVRGVKANDPIIMAPTGLKPAAKDYFDRYLDAFDRWAEG